MLHQVNGLGRPLLVREWTLDCAEPPEGCARRLVLVPAADPLYWPLRLQGRDPARGHRDVGFRLVLE
ncbi:MAG: hypothetical protein RML12_04525 [Xanthomonadales bacterium]|nr:hypothetical protein [Xanthomonadales bacterium]